MVMLASRNREPTGARAPSGGCLPSVGLLLTVSNCCLYLNSAAGLDNGVGLVCNVATPLVYMQDSLHRSLLYIIPIVLSTR